MQDIQPATKKLTTKAAVEDYVAGFNSDDFRRFSGYYAEDALLNIPALEDKSLAGYIAWLKAMHTTVSEELLPQNITIDQAGRQVNVDYHVQFKGLGDFTTENFNGRLGPVSRGIGPLVQMSLTYQLNLDGYIAGIEVSNFALLEQAK